MSLNGFHRKKICLLVITFMVTTALVLPSCSKRKTKGTAPMEVAVCPVTTEELSKQDKYIGQVVAIESVDVVARVVGYLERRLFKPGDYVTRGQLLFQIQKDQYYAQLNQAQGDYDHALATYQNMVVEYNRQRELVPTRAISVRDYDNAAQNYLNAKGNLLSAQGNVELQKLNISYTDVYSPMDGRIGMYNYSVGNVVGPSSKALATVMQVDPIWVEFPVSETILNVTGLYPSPYNGQIIPTKEKTDAVNKNIIVKIAMPSGDEYPYHGEINYIDNKIDPTAGTIQVRAVFPNPKGVLVPGGFMDIVFKSKEKVIRKLVYQPAIQQDLRGFYVYVVSAEGIAEKRYIEKGDTHGMMVSVSKGLEPGEKVVVSRLIMIKDGMKVVPIDKPEILTEINTETARSMNPD